MEEPERGRKKRRTDDDFSSGGVSPANEYLALYSASMSEMSSFGWLDGSNNSVLDLPPGRPSEYVHVLGSYFDNVITPLRRLFAWSVPSSEAIEAIVDRSKGGVCEIGAGTGYWAMLIRKRGLKVVAYDRWSTSVTPSSPSYSPAYIHLVFLTFSLH